MAAGDGSFLKIDISTGVTALSDTLDTGQLRVGQPVDPSDLPSDPAAADDIPGTKFKQDGRFVYERKYGVRPDGTSGWGWAIVGTRSSSPVVPTGPVSVSPSTASMSGPTTLTIRNTDGWPFTVDNPLDAVVVTSGGQPLLTATSYSVDDANTVTATIPPGSHNNLVQAGTAYDLRLEPDMGLFIYISGVLTFA